MKEITRRRLRATARIGAIAALGGGLFGFASSHAEPLVALRGAIIGGVIGTVLSLFELLFLSGRSGVRLRRLPFTLVLAIRAVVSFTVFAVALSLGPILIKDPEPGATGASFQAAMAFSAGLSLVFLIVLQVDAMLGQGELWKLVRGRYHRPLEEERIFLLIDLIDSTAIAERIGGVRFFELLNRLYEDIAEPIAEHRGAIHKYVGDEVIVTWTPETGLPEARALACALAIDAAVTAKAASYRAEFGAVPRFRAGLHLGLVVSGELGSGKREIAYLGDTINTATRLIDACRELGCICIASKSIIDRVELPPGIRAEPLGEKTLRGKEKPISLYTVTRSAPPG